MKDQELRQSRRPSRRPNRRPIRRPQGIGIAAAVAATMALSAPAVAFDMMSADEVQALHNGTLDGARPSLMPRTLMRGAPVIELVQPGKTAGVRPPLDIRLVVRSDSGSTVRMDTLKVEYVGSLFDFDITDRILEHARLDGASIAADNAELPPGEHRIRVSVADDRDRRGQRTFSFEILED